MCLECEKKMVYKTGLKERKNVTDLVSFKETELVCEGELYRWKENKKLWVVNMVTEVNTGFVVGTDQVSSNHIEKLNERRKDCEEGKI